MRRDCVLGRVFGCVFRCFVVRKPVCNRRAGASEQHAEGGARDHESSDEVLHRDEKVAAGSGVG